MTLSAAQIKKIRSLKDKKFREELSLFVVEGEKMVAEAMESRFVVEDVFRIEDIGEETMSRISCLNSPSPVLALVRKPDNYSAAPVLKGGEIYLALDSIRDPGNLGTILRVADWFDVDGVFASRDTVDIFNPKVVQSTMGALFRVQFHYTDICRLCSTSGAEVFGTFLEGDDIYKADLSATGPAVIVIGNEANGISPRVGDLCRHRITIPSFASGRGSESLNAAIATAITVSEFKRRKL